MSAMKMRRAPIKQLPSVDELTSLLDYDPDAGVLTWKVAHRQLGGVAGVQAGTVGHKGYMVIGINRRYYLAHRLIWKIMTGEDPIDQIDHIDGDRLNNRWVNFRSASNSENRFNSRLSSNNTSGHKGVTYYAARASWKKWRAVITAEKRTHHLGWFATADDASAAREAAAFTLHGEYARLR